MRTRARPVVNLEQLRKQAKELVRAARAGDEKALARILAHAPARERSRARRGAAGLERPRARARLRPRRPRRAPARLGGGPNEGALLVHAVRRGCRSELLRLLAVHGAELDCRGGEWSTPPEEYKTAYQNAVLRGRNDYATLLKELGASTEVAPEDLAVAAVVRGDRPEGGLPETLAPHAQEALWMALERDVDLVLDLVGPNFFAHAGGGPPGTLLHHAAWVGNVELARQLLERGADPVARSGAKFDTPAAWAALGSQHWREEGRDHVGVIELLLAAGAELEPRFTEVAEGPLADWLEGRT